jgi:phosphinothricin acetyltransferase
MSALLRLASLNNAEQIAAVYAPYCETPISFELMSPDAEEMRQRMSRVLQQYPWLVCEEAGKVIAYAYASAHRERAAYRWSVDVSVYIDQHHHRRGIGSALYTSLFKLLRLQGYINAYAGITLPNAGSVGLHEAMGFQPVGVYPQVGYKYGVWHDVGWYQLLLQPRTNKPAEPRGWREVCGTPEWTEALQAGSGLLCADR